MSKIIACIKKDFLQLWADKIGLALMFLMPILLVIIITLVQNSAFKIVNENKISILIYNQDKGEFSNKIIKTIKKSGFFDSKISHVNNLTEYKKELNKGNYLTGLYIHQNFSEKLDNQAAKISALVTGSENNHKIKKQTPIELYFDPILTDNYTQSIKQVVSSYVSILENEIVINKMTSLLNLDTPKTKYLQRKLLDRPQIHTSTTNETQNNKIPNATEHNVPAWTIFAIFFMVNTLGSSITTEKINGSFMRLKTVPTNFSVILLSKLILFTFVAFMQSFVIFGIGNLLFTHIGLPKLYFPDSIFNLMIVTFFISLTAISYSIMIGILTKTQEQANGIGAISVVIFSAIGGIWVPTFAMPDYLKVISKISPLNWSLEAYYAVFLKGESFLGLLPYLTALLLFTSICITIIYLKLRKNNLL